MIETLLIASLSCGTATYYGMGDGYHGRSTAFGETFNTYAHTVAHPYLKKNTRLLVTNQNNGKQVIVRVNDRGPAIDLSYAAFTQIASAGQGRVPVCWRVVG